MKNCFLTRLAIGCLLAFGVSTGQADTVTIDFTTGTTNGPIAVLGDLGTEDRVFSAISASPLTADVFGIADPADVTGTGTAVPGLTLSIINGEGTSGIGEEAFFNVTSASLGVNSAGGDETDRFDSAFGELLTIAFNQDIDIISIDLVSFTGAERFTVGGLSFTADEDVNSVFTFTPGTASFAAGEGILLAATDGSVGIEGITIEVAAVPEPSSAMLIALGVSVLGLLRRRSC